MAAYVSPHGNSAQPIVPSTQSSWGDSRDVRPPSSSGPDGPASRVLPHINDIVDSARPSLRDASLSHYLEEAERCFNSSRSSLDFGRPHIAFRDYLIAYEIAIDSIPKHHDFGFWEHNQLAWARRYKSLKQKLVEVDNQMSGVQRAIKENNARHNTQPRNESRKSVYDTGFGVPSANGHSLSQPLSPSATADLPPALRAGAQRPPSRPKPEGLQGRPISQTVNDLSERFAKLRSPGNGSGDSPTLSMPRASDYQGRAWDRPLSYPSHDPHVTNGVLQPRPNGPRDMPNGGLPAIPPKLPLATAVHMPKAPSPTYSPITPSASGTPGHVSRHHEGRPPNEHRQKYYNQPQHGSSSSLQLSRTRDEILMPYRPTTPNGVNSAVVPKSQSSQIPHDSIIDAATLYEYMKKYNVLLIDIRDRAAFDEGHIMASSIICIEPTVLKEGASAEDLEDRLVISPDTEQALFARRNDFDVLVYHDQYTEDSTYLKGPPTMTNAPALRAFYDTLYEFNETKPLKDGRPPALLRGGIDAWTDYMGVHSLARSRTASLLGTTRQRGSVLGRPVARQRLVSNNSRFDVRNRRLRGHSFLNERERQEWAKQAHEEEVEPQAKEAESDSDYSVNEEEQPPSPFVSDVDSFLRRFPSVHNDQQSMTRPSRRAVGAPPRHSPPPPPLPAIPSRPTPALPRPSYSGQSDIIQSQAPLARVTSSARAPLYSSVSLSRMKKLPRTGLTNFGVTCYMNSTLQCLSATIPLSSFFTDRRYEGYVQKNWKGSSGIMPKFYANLVQALWNDDCEGIKPSSFRQFCGRMNSEWMSDRQEDAKEFFDFLVDCLHEDLNVNWERNPLRPLDTHEEAQRERMQIVKASPIEWQRYEHRDRSFVSSLFAGQHASRLRCLTCNSTSTTYEAFYSISIEIPRSGAGSIYDCLRSYCKEEKLSELWKCPHCQCERQATKQIILTRLPSFLVIHFKRFAASKYERAKKIHTPIDFPIQGLNMDDFVIPRPPPVLDQDGQYDLATTPPYKYDAYGVLRHIGGSMESGHYISLVKDPGRGTWRKFDDDRATDFEPKSLSRDRSLCNGEAYILFFQRVQLR